MSEHHSCTCICGSFAYIQELQQSSSEVTAHLNWASSLSITNTFNLFLGLLKGVRGSYQLC